MQDDYGLRESNLKALCHIMEKYPDVAQALIFSSRAKGNYKSGSDVDIALKGEYLNTQIINHISFELNEETTTPYQFDVSNYHNLTEPILIDHINRVGKVFYEKASN